MKRLHLSVGLVFACCACSPQAQQQAEAAAQQVNAKAQAAVESDAAQRYAASAQRWAQSEAPKAEGYAKAIVAKVTRTRAQIDQAKRRAKAALANRGG